MGAVIIARELLGKPPKSLLTTLPPKFILKFDDGEYRTTRRRTCASAYFWDYHRKFPMTPLKKSHHFQHLLENKFYNSDTHLDLCQNIEKDVFDIYENDVENLVALVSKIAYDSSIQMTNELMPEFAPYVAPFDLLDGIEIQRHPEIQKVMSEATTDGRSVKIVYDVAHKVIMEDPSLDDNGLAFAYRANTVKREQVLQSVTFRGIPTEPDGTLFRISVNTGYLEGMTKIYDFVTDSRSAPKAQMSAEAPLQESEYMARRLQFLVSVVKKISGRDCGSKDFTQWFVEPEVRDDDGSVVTPSGVEALVGKYMEDPKTGQLIELKGNEKELEGEYIRLRSVLTCKNNDPHTVCKTCFGGLYRNYYDHANLGHLCCVTITEKITQNTLSTKHLVATGEGARIILNNDSAKFFKIGRVKTDYTLISTLKRLQIKVTIGRSEATNFTAVMKMNDISDLRLNQISQISEIQITYRDKGVEVQEVVNLKQGNRYAYMTQEFLEYIRTAGYKVDKHNNFEIDMKDWNYSHPVFSVPQMEISYSEYGQEVGKMIESNMSQIEERQKPGSPVNTLQELSSLVNSKLKIPLSCLEVIVYASMIPNRNNPAMARHAKNPVLGVARQTIYFRSLSCAYAFQGHSDFMLNPRSFFPANRPSNDMDVFFAPKEVVAEALSLAGL